MLCFVCRYNTNKNQWSVAPSMHTCRSAAGAAMLGNYIYVVGTNLKLHVHTSLISVSSVQEL